MSVPQSNSTQITATPTAVADGALNTVSGDRIGADLLLLLATLRINNTTTTSNSIRRRAIWLDSALLPDVMVIQVLVFTTVHGQLPLVATATPAFAVSPSVVINVVEGRQKARNVARDARAVALPAAFDHARSADLGALVDAVVVPSELTD